MVWTSKIVHIDHQMEVISKLATAPCFFISSEIFRKQYQPPPSLSYRDRRTPEGP